jgi:5-methylthioadenosine/S-adenosylhomocysteine deaminase
MTDLIVAGTLLSMDDQRTIWSDGGVLVRAGLIHAIDQRLDLLEKHPDARVVGGPGNIVTPGFVNAHQHLTGDRLIRSCIPDDILTGEAISYWGGDL